MPAKNVEAITVLAMPITFDFAPRLMPAPHAAHYLGISVSMLRTLGLPRKILGSKRLYDRYDLDRFASELPTEGDSNDDDAERMWDEAMQIEPGPKPWVKIGGGRSHQKR